MSEWKQQAAQRRDERHQLVDEEPRHRPRSPRERKRFGIRFEAMTDAEVRAMGISGGLRWLRQPYTRWYSSERARDEALQTIATRGTTYADTEKARRKTKVER